MIGLRRSIQRDKSDLIVLIKFYENCNQFNVVVFNAMRLKFLGNSLSFKFLGGINGNKFAKDLMDGEFFAGRVANFNDLSEKDLLRSILYMKMKILMVTGYIRLLSFTWPSILQNRKLKMSRQEWNGFFVAELLLNWGIDSRSYGLLFSSIFEPFRKAFKKSFGFNVLDIKREAERVDKQMSEDDKKRFKRKRSFPYFVRPLGEADGYVAYDDVDCAFYDTFNSYVYNFLRFDVILHDKDFAKEFDRLMMKNDKPFYYTDLFYATLHNNGVLAKLLGYDGVLDASHPADTIRVLDRKRCITSQYV